MLAPRPLPFDDARDAAGGAPARGSSPEANGMQCPGLPRALDQDASR
ncbi:hypothetical protein J2X52_003024 [Luteimonas sp. 3794]|nr:hypothetical protein [Luteimonas sp. 3794]